MQNQAHNHNVLDSSRIGNLLMKLSTPIFFGVLIQNIYQIVDTIFIGRYVGSDGLAALSIIMPIQMIVMGANNMVSVGGASLISRLIGQREQQRAERALGNSIFFAVLFSLVLTAAVVPFISFWLNFIGTSENVTPYAASYLTIMMSGIIFNITGLVLLSMARAEGNARVSMIYLILQSVLSIAMDAVFMIGFKMGLAGAALAIVIAQGVGVAYLISYYLTGGSYLKLHWRNFIPERSVVKDIFTIGISQFLKSIVDCLSAFILVRVFSRYGGDVGLSAFSVVQRVMMFASMPSMVISQALQPVLGFNYGARRFRQALKSIKLATITSLILGAAALIVLMVFPGPIIRVFTSDAHLIESSRVAFRLMFLGMPFFGFFNVAQLVFPSTGKALPTFIISVLRPLCIIIPLSLVLPYFFQITGAWLIFPGTDTLSALLALVFLMPLIRKFRKSAGEQEKSTIYAEPVPQP
jgi:putative MATE family efflux protein